MSVQAISWVLEHSESTGTARCVLMSIANHLDPDGEGWVHVERVCREARCSEDSYRRAVKWAIDHGELEREVRAGGSARTPDVRRPNLFRFPAMRPLQSAGDGDSDPRDLRGTDPRDLRGTSPSRSAGDGSRAVHEPSSEPSGVAPAEADPFDLFWKAYPRKVGKPKAQAAYRSAVAKRKADPAAILAGLARWVAYWSEKNQPEYVPHPTTWLNQDRWNDEPPALRRSGLAAVADVLDGFDEAGVRPGSTFGPGAGRAAPPAANPRTGPPPASSGPSGDPSVDGRLAL